MSLPVFPPCRHRGGEAAAGVHRCHSPKLSGRKLVTAPLCRECYCRDHGPEDAPPAPAGRDVPGTFHPRPGDPPCAVVLGSYNWPHLVEMQIYTIRDTCGPVPILVSDDCSPGFGPPVAPGGKFARL
jgi:hypothetical protein